jgi:hypothetical protein
MTESPLFSYGGKILRVNLTSGEVRTEPTSLYAREWIGASGIAIKILYDELRPWVTPYDPANLHENRPDLRRDCDGCLHPVILLRM